LAAAKAELNRAEAEELINRADRELLDSWTEPSVTRARGVLLGKVDKTADGSESHLDPASLSAADLAGQLQKSVEVMKTVASYRKGYKGTSQKVLREAAHVVRTVGAELLGRTQDDESRRLRAANAQLSSEVEELRRQLGELKKRVADMASSKEPTPPPCPAPDPPLMEVSSPPLPQRKRPRRNADDAPGLSHSSSSTQSGGKEKEGGQRMSPQKTPEEGTDPGAEALINAITNRVAAFVNARFAAIEKRLLPEKIRPALQAEKKMAEAAQAKSYAEAAAAAPSKKTRGGGGKRAKPKSSPATSDSESGKTRGKKAEGKTVSTTGGGSKANKSLQETDESSWTKVGRGRASKTVEKGKTAANEKAADKAAKATSKTADKATEEVPPLKREGIKTETGRKARVGKIPKKGIVPHPNPERFALLSRQPCC